MSFKLVHWIETRLLKEDVSSFLFLRNDVINHMTFHPGQAPWAFCVEDTDYRDWTMRQTASPPRGC